MRWTAGLFAPAIIAAGALPALGQNQRDTSLVQALANARHELVGIAVPPADSFTVGDREIPVGTTVAGPVAIVGTLRVAGTIAGDAFAYGGDIIVVDSGHIAGSAVSFDGRVRVNGGLVDGDARTIQGAGQAVQLPATTRSTGDHVALTLGWAAIVLIVGIGVLVFGGKTLDSVAVAVDEHFGRAFVTGLGATLAIAPALALLVVGLVLTLLGILLVPFAIVAYVLAVTGLITLGFLAAVRITGQSLARKRRAGLSERGAALQALVVGVVFYMGLWLVAALLTSAPAAAAVARVIAFALTWAAATVGLGATILTRAGTRPAHGNARAPIVAQEPPASPFAPELAPPPAHWETPTPVSGVVAARRPTSVKR
jgi:hypothetical protein